MLQGKRLQAKETPSIYHSVTAGMQTSECTDCRQLKPSLCFGIEQLNVSTSGLRMRRVVALTLSLSLSLADYGGGGGADLEDTDCGAA